MRNHDDIHKFHEKVTFQLNDTHPTVAVAELMRILLDEYYLTWEEACYLQGFPAQQPYGNLLYQRNLTGSTLQAVRPRCGEC